jgi:hypothetical protein
LVFVERALLSPVDTSLEAKHGRELKPPLSPNEEVTFRRIALGITKATGTGRGLLDPSVEENKGQVVLTGISHERYQGRPNSAAVSDVEDEATAVLKRHLLHARDPVLILAKGTITVNASSSIANLNLPCQPQSAIQRAPRAATIRATWAASHVDRSAE